MTGQVAGRPTPRAQRAGCLPRTPSGRWVVLATVLGSGMVLLDTTAVNVALPTVGRALGASLGGLQWIVSGYTLALAALILLGGSLGDRLGRRRVFVTGVIWFALASAMCGLAPTIGVLVAARVLQGVGGALLVPGSLAIIQTSFAPGDRPAAIGAWASLGNLATAAGPLLGGWLVAAAGWRWVFLVNLPVAAAVVIVTLRRVPESRDDCASGSFDVLGALLAVLALAGIAFVLIGGAGSSGAERVAVVAAGIAGVGGAVAFVAVERSRGRSVSDRVPAPMLPLAIFASRQFSAINMITFCVYCATGGELFMLVLELQSGAGYSALAAGSALLPVTVLMIVLSPRSAALAQRTGPRWPITAGAATCARPAARAQDRRARVVPRGRASGRRGVRRRDRADRLPADGDGAGQRGRAERRGRQRREQRRDPRRRADRRGGAAGGGRPAGRFLPLPGAPDQRLSPGDDHLRWLALRCRAAGADAHRRSRAGRTWWQGPVSAPRR